MSELLSSKQSISIRQQSIKNNQVQYIVSANDKTQFFNRQEISNNHEEADTLIIHTLEQIKPTNCNVIVHATDTYVFFNC